MPPNRASLRRSVRQLRTAGKSFAEINTQLNAAIPKSTLSYMCRDIKLTPHQNERIVQIRKINTLKHQKLAVAANKRLLAKRIIAFKNKNRKLRNFIQSPDAQLVALAMLYLGEGAKWNRRRGLLLSNTDPSILRLYMRLLNNCFQIKPEQLRFRIQHRHDQESEHVVAYWCKVLVVSKSQFYPSYVDKRTAGKPTTKPGYMGVCSITCAGTNIQLELAQIAVIINEALGC